MSSSTWADIDMKTYGIILASNKLVYVLNLDEHGIYHVKAGDSSKVLQVKPGGIVFPVKSPKVFQVGEQVMVDPSATWSMMSGVEGMVCRILMVKPEVYLYKVLFAVPGKPDLIFQYWANMLCIIE